MVLDDPITSKLSNTISLAISGYRLDLKGQNDGTIIKKQNMSEIPKILAFLGPNPVTLTEPPGIRNVRQQQTLWDKESGVRFLLINFFINEKIQIMVTDRSHRYNFSFKQALPSHKELIISEKQ